MDTKGKDKNHENFGKKSDALVRARVNLPHIGNRKCNKFVQQNSRRMTNFKTLSIF
jgi:hypothetical protein